MSVELITIGVDFGVHQANDLHPPPFVAVQDTQNLGGAVSGANYQDISIVVTLLAEDAQGKADQDLFGQQEKKRQDKEGSEKAPAEPLRLNEEYNRGGQHPANGSDCSQRFQDGPGRAHALRVVISVAVQKYEPDRNDNDQYPGIGLEMSESTELNSQVECQ